MNANRIKTLVVILATMLLASPAASYALEGGTLGSADASFLGEAANDNAGISVASAGDVNGDGYADVIVGARYNDAGGSDAGAVYLVLGGPGGWSPGASRGWGQGIDLGSAGVIRYTGEAEGDQAGQSVAGAGDVNGDGYADFIVGAYRNDTGENNAGAAYLVLGSADPISGSLSSAVRYTGVAAGDNAGYSVAGAGDVNGDGYADVVIGAFGNDTMGDMSGATYLVLGSASPTSGSLSSAALAKRYTGQGMNDYSGYSVAGAGDVNGDGYADIVIGAYGQDAGGTDAGAVYLVLGRAEPASGNLVSAVRYAGETASDYAGWSVAGAGDVNGDGYGDFLIGSYGYDAGVSNTGAAYLVLGSANPSSGSLASAVRYSGVATEDWAGYSVAGAGDVNGDGYGDLLVGAINDDAGGQNAGAAYLALGSASLISGSLTSAVRYAGETAGDYAGTSVAGAGDVNGDGYVDLLVGAIENDAGGASAGAAYLVLSDYLASGAAPIRQWQRLLGSGNALPVSFEQIGVRVDLASSALAGGDVTVERHVFHPCRTDWRLQMPIWSISSSKHHNAPDGSSITNLVFHYTDAQLGDMDEGQLQVWSRPIGESCGEWSMVPPVSHTVASGLNLVTVSGLTELGNQYTLSVDPPPTAVGTSSIGVHSAVSGLVLAVLLMALALAAAFVYWLWRRARPMPAGVKFERLQGVTFGYHRGVARRSDGRHSGNRWHADTRHADVRHADVRHVGAARSRGGSK